MRHRFCLITLLSAALLVPVVSPATEYWPPDDPRWEIQAQAAETEPLHFETQRDLAEYLLWKGLLAEPEEGRARFTGEGYLENLAEAAAFIATLQVDDPDSVDFGGMREGEHLPDIIESDNTQESIWVWSRYHALTGETTFDGNVEAAWQYIMNFPAYNEEGGTGPLGYYRVYNCAWGLWATMGYEQATGDADYRDYGDSCAVYLMTYPLDIWTGVFPYNTLNGLVQSWAAGTLYRYGVYRDDSSIKQAASLMGRDVKDWVEDNPGRGLSRENWAMSGGATMWGLLNSYFCRRPDLAADWLGAYASYLKVFDEDGPLNTAHNMWYALGHYAVWDALGTAGRKVNHRLLVEAMMGLDGDDDGGIPAQTDEPDTTDQSWVTNYLSFMGLDALVPAGDVSARPESYIVPAGGTLTVRIAVASNADSAGIFSARIDVETPSGPFPGNPVLGPIDIGLGPWEVLSVSISHPVPGTAPAGLYSYRAVIERDGEEVGAGDFPFLVVR
jgi:hypothetical protein